MKEQFITYLSSIGMEELLIERVNGIYQFYEDILSTKFQDEITDIFVTDYITKEGTREYENLWLFSRKFFMESKLFIKQDDFDIFPISKEITYLEIKKQDYDFSNPSDISRFNVKFVSELKGSGELKASKENCKYLKNIYMKYMLENLSV